MPTGSCTKGGRNTKRNIQTRIIPNGLARYTLERPRHLPLMGGPDGFVLCLCPHCFSFTSPLPTLVCVWLCVCYPLRPSFTSFHFLFGLWVGLVCVGGGVGCGDGCFVWGFRFSLFLFCSLFLATQTPKSNIKNSHFDHKKCVARGNKEKVTLLFIAFSPDPIEIWLILPVVICLFQGLSHACLRITALQESAHGSLHQT